RCPARGGAGGGDIAVACDTRRSGFWYGRSRDRAAGAPFGERKQLSSTHAGRIRARHAALAVGDDGIRPAELCGRALSRDGSQECRRGGPGACGKPWTWRGNLAARQVAL